MKHEVYLHMNEQLHPSPDSVEEAVRSATRKRKPHIRMKKTVVSLIAVAVLYGSVSLAASANEDFRQMLTEISPSFAAHFTPVMKSCTRDGYRMTVEGVHIDGDNSHFLIAFEDLEGNTDEAISIYDFGIQRVFPPGFDMTSGGNTSLGLDETTNQYQFEIRLNEPGAGEYWSKTITFSVPDILVGFHQQDNVEVPIDWSTVDYQPQMRRNSRFSDGILVMQHGEPQPFYEEIQISGVGYSDGKLHIQTQIDDWNGDSACCLYLVDADRNRIDSINDCYCDWGEGEVNYQTHWWEHHYHEHIFEVDADALQDCKVLAWTRTGGRHVRGNWKVKFPLKEEQ